MLDLRPLVFLNVLAFLLLLTAGFVRLNAGTLPALENESPVAEATESAARPVTELPAIIDSELPPAQQLSDFVPARDEDAETFEDALLFVDQLDEEAVEELPAPSLARLDTPQTPASQQAKKAVEPPPPPPEPVIELPTTGLVTVRSNVSRDQVYINGKAMGSSGKALELEAGEYEVKVAKQGYRTWRSRIDLARGDKRMLVVTLERLTRVEFRDGKWINGVVTGNGTWEQDGAQYTGEFQDKKFHGKGTYANESGVRYEGEWFQGNKHGMGTLNREDGSVYIGEFRDDQFNGQGTLTRNDGDIYSGYWINGSLSGDGSLTRRDGTLYTGGFAEGVFQGQGSLTYPDGTYYEGSFANGLYQGKGELTYADGKKYIGNFLEGQFHGQGEWLNPNGSKISGSFKFGKPFGVATLTTAEGEVFTARSDNPGVCYRLKSYRATQCPVLEGW